LEWSRELEHGTDVVYEHVWIDMANEYSRLHLITGFLGSRELSGIEW
jgi:hypothetical protein